MADLPSHPDADDASDLGRDRLSGPSPKAVAGFVAVAVLLVLMVVLHLAGVFGPGSH